MKKVSLKSKTYLIKADTCSRISRQLFKVTDSLSNKGLNSTKSIDLILEVEKTPVKIFFMSFIFMPSCTGVPVPGTNVESSESISKLK